MAELHITEQTTPSTPAANKLKIFADSVDNKLKQVDSSGVVKDLTDSAAPADNCRIGSFDYNDFATAGTPITCTADVPTILTNDGAGGFTNKTHAPVGVTDVYDEVNNFDWSQLKLGDMVDIRLDISVVTASVNTTVHVELNLGTGGGAYAIPFVSGIDFKDADTHAVNVYNGIYLGDANTLDNGGQFTITCDKNSTVTVNGWYCKVLIKG